MTTYTPGQMVTVTNRQFARDRKVELAYPIPSTTCWVAHWGPTSGPFARWRCYVMESEIISHNP